MLQEVFVPSLSIEPFVPLIGKRQAERMWAAVRHARILLDGRTLWNINSTATGGGVAEMLQTFLAYERGGGVDARWLVIGGDPEFFAITKRLHNRLHGSLGDGGSLAERERTHYGEISRRNAEGVRTLIRPHDVVILHDPQTAGLIPTIRQVGATVIWRCHIGTDTHNGVTEGAWTFLQPYLDEAHAFVFSRGAYVPSWLAKGHVTIIPPSIDAFSVKNHHMSLATARAILTHIGVLGANGGRGKPVFTRSDGSVTQVRRRAEVLHAGCRPAPDVPLVVQVSRWDHLKDMLGVMRGFAEYVDSFQNAHLALVGPNVWGVADDPEGITVLAECITAWHELPPAKRSRVQLVCLPMEDIEENAAMVNALQRHAAVIVQKSLHEGFGLTVTEAMWKGRPIVASAVGGIQDQIVSGEHGLLLEDPTDLKAFGAALRRLLADRVLSQRLGRNARRRAVSHFLAPSYLVRQIELLAAMNGHLSGSQNYYESSLGV